MALINCPECTKEISDKAVSCPNCGVPLVKVEVYEPTSTDAELLKCPDFPIDFNIGQQITNWAFDAAFNGFYDGRENLISKIPSGKVSVLLHTHGIQIVSGLTFFPIHESQIISLRKTSHEELAKIDKSVIGRAVVGGMILGPLGAIVGGMSGIGSKERFINKQYFVINYWDVQTQTAQTILISSDESVKIDAFINRQQKEQNKNLIEDRVADKNTTPTWMIICLIIIVLSVVVIIIS
jgi:hypothetical protein